MAAKKNVKGMQMERERRRPFFGDIGEHTVHLLLREARGRSNPACRDIPVERIEAHVHFLMRQGKVEFLLCLRERKRIGCRRSAEDVFRNPECPRDLVDLCLVKMTYRKEVYSTVTIFCKETYSKIFNFVTCSTYQAII